MQIKAITVERRLSVELESLTKLQSFLLSKFSLYCRLSNESSFSFNPMIQRHVDEIFLSLLHCSQLRPEIFLQKFFNQEASE